MRREHIEPGNTCSSAAGCSNPDLLKREAEQLIAAADLRFHDALVDRTILEIESERMLSALVWRIGAILPIGKSVRPTGDLGVDIEAMASWV